MNNKIVRSICYFSKNVDTQVFQRLNEIEKLLITKGYLIQTKRVCSPSGFKELEQRRQDKNMLFSVGTMATEETISGIADFYEGGDLSFNLDLTKDSITQQHVQILLDIIKNQPSKTFNFAYVFNNEPSSPFFPSASYKKDGFSLGLQSTDLSEACQSLDEWLLKMKETWIELVQILSTEADFLGIDSSVAPLFEGKSSLISFIRKLQIDFKTSSTTDVYLKITNYIKQDNPKPVGLCGLMFPCLEDFELADEYSKEEFSIERNIYLSLHSGLGIDTYPVGVNEKPERLLEILKTVQGLSNKHTKALSIRFVSDGKARIGDMTNFQNQYLKDVVVRAL